MAKTTKAKSIKRTTNTVISVCWRIIEVTLVIMIFYVGVTKSYAFGHAIFSGRGVENKPGRDITFVIEEGDSMKKVAAGLKNLGLIEDTLVCQIQEKLFEYEIYPGTYELNTSMSSKEMLKLFNVEPKEEGTEAAK